jgi:hypothetical protein
MRSIVWHMVHLFATSSAPPVDCPGEPAGVQPTAANTSIVAVHASAFRAQDAAIGFS